MERLLFVAAFLVEATAEAGLTGQVSATGQGLALEAGTPNGGTQQTFAAMLQENLGLLYTGTPFGPSVALVGAGLQASNLNSWGANGAPISARTATLDLSVGLLPRRAIPVRLYARGTLSDGGLQSIPTLGGRESVAVGVNVNLEPGGWLPGVRADFEEQHFTGVGAATPLGDLRRFATLGLSRSVGREQLALTGRFDQEQRALTGSWMGVTVNGTWASPTHQTTLVGTWVQRSLVTVLPGAPTATTERQARVDHTQRWSSHVSTDAHVRAGDARFDTGTGALGNVALGLTWKPLDGEDLVVNGGGDLGLTHTSSSGFSQSAGGALRGGYSRTLGPVRGGLFAGGAAQWCGCTTLTTGVLTTVDLGASLGTQGLSRFEARVDYRFALVGAPLGRGGKRNEHHLLGFSRVRTSQHTELSLNAGYDDGFRDYLDVSSGGLGALHEQAFFVGGTFTFALGRGSGTADLRHAEGSVILPQGLFVDGPPPTARALTSASLFVMLPLSQSLELSLGAQGAWASLDRAAPLSTVGGSAGVNVRLGRISAQLNYQFTRADTVGLVSTQHFVRLSLSRPFEIF